MTPNQVPLSPVRTTPATPLTLPAALSQAQRALDRIVLGKPLQIRLALACLLARGHLLLEDLPGVGKTTLAHALARTLGLQYQRVQFTSDLLPTDLIGVSIYVKEKGAFEFHPGPLFAQVVLADEINRATPKAQSALLEAMAEGQVTHDGATYPLPEPFFVIATQNPLNQIGTHPCRSRSWTASRCGSRWVIPIKAPSVRCTLGAVRRRTSKPC